MPSKKKKFNARFPPARIKKIMQMDDEVGKVAQAVPVIISRTLELFVESLLKKAEVVTVARNAKTLTPSHLKQCVLAEQRFDFLKDLVENIPDSQGDEDCMTPAADTPRSSTSHSPFVFPVVGRGSGASGSSTSTSRSSSSSVSTPTPIISEAPPVIAANNQQQPRPHDYLPPVPPYYQPYDSVIVQPNQQPLTGPINNPYIPPQLISAPLAPQIQPEPNIHQTQTAPFIPPVLSHFEYLPHNYSPSTTISNNGLNFSMRQSSTESSGVPNSSVIVSAPGSGKGAYQRQSSFHE